MGNLKTDEDDDFITSASPETEPDERSEEHTSELQSR